MGHEKNTGMKREAATVGKVQTPGEWGGTLGAARPPEWTPNPTEWNGRRGAARPPENTNGGGVESSWDESTPREVRGPEGVETLGAPTVYRTRQGDDGWGRRGRGRKPTYRPTQQGAANQWRRRSGATGRGRNEGRGGGGGDGAASRWHGAPDSTPHRRGFVRGGGRHSQRGPRRLRRRAK